jgi:cysteinyl-tRNA synthetase, unknown class
MTLQNKNMANDSVPAGKAPQNVAGWSFNINNAALESLLQNDSKFLVIDYSQDGTEARRYSASDIAALHQKDKEAVSYLSIGEAEEYRYYYQSSWKTNPPSWMGKENPSWPGNIKVKFWDPEWQKIMFNYLDKIIDNGFDGIYLDIVDGYDYWSDPNNGEGLVLDRADAASRMIDFIGKLTEYARVQRGKPDFYIIPQNGEELLRFDKDGSFLKNISAVGVEDLYFDETSSNSSDSINYRTTDLNKVTAAGKPVLVIDYVDDGSGYQGNNKLRIDSFWGKATNAGYTPQISSVDRALLTYSPINATLAGIVGQTTAPIISSSGVGPSAAVIDTTLTTVVTPAPAVPAPIQNLAVTPTSPAPPSSNVGNVDNSTLPTAEKLFGGSGDDLIKTGSTNDYLVGSRGNDILIAGAGNDIAYGEWDRDYIDGGDGNDMLWGNDDDDTLLGGAGNDRLVGDRGNDRLTGGTGKDIFVYENFEPRTLGRDIITDFEAGIDRIELRLNIFSKLSPGQFLRPEEFEIVNSPQAAASSSALVVYDATSGDLFYNSNGSDPGFGEGDNIANLSNRPSLTAADFILV